MILTHAMHANIERFWERVSELDDVLLDDIQRAHELLELSDTPSHRRFYCRAIISFLEGVVNNLKAFSIEFYSGVLGDGEIRDLQRRSGVLESAFHAFDLFTNVSGADTPLKRESEEWLVLKKAVKIRNRITHPQNATDLEISNLDLVHLRTTLEVIFNIIEKSLHDSARANFRRAKDFSEKWKSGLKSQLGKPQR